MSSCEFPAHCRGTSAHATSLRCGSLPKIRNCFLQDELEEARYERRRAVAAARQDTERACAEAARQKANADILSIMIMRMVQACKPAEGC